MTVEVLHSLPEPMGEQGVIGLDQSTGHLAVFYDVFDPPPRDFNPGQRFVEQVDLTAGTSSRLGAEILGQDETAELNCEEPTTLGRRLFGTLPLGCYAGLEEDLVTFGRITARYGAEGNSAVTGMAASPGGGVAWLPTRAGCFKVDLEEGHVVRYSLAPVRSPAVGAQPSELPQASRQSDPFIGFDAAAGPTQSWLLHSAAALFVARRGEAPALVDFFHHDTDVRRIDSAVFRSEREILLAYASDI